MKKLIILIIIISSSFTTYSQSNISIDDLVTKIKSTKKSINTAQKLPLRIQQEYFDQTFSSYEILKDNSSNFRIVGKSNDKTIFHLTHTNGHTGGMALQIDKEFGYKISSSPSSGTLIFTKTPKEKIIYTCGTPNYNNTEHPIPEKNTKSTKRYAIGNSGTTTNPLLLESRPGATHLIYLEYTYNGIPPGWEKFGYKANAFTVPDNEKRKIWEAIAEDYLPFDVNITTNKRLYDNHPELTRGWVIFANFNQPGWLGVAFIDGYTEGSPPVLVDLPSSFGGNHQYLYRTPSHELGHGFGLKHDGKQDKEYYLGHGEYVSIMGTGDRLVTHWSKGEYAGATVHEDDIEIIKNILGLATDDHTTNQPLTVTNTIVSPKKNFGFIGTRNDTDTFTINLDNDGDIILTISSPIASRSNLDIKATLTDSNGAILQTSSPIGDRSAYINQSLPKGTYFLEIDGVGELTVNDGFSDYSSLGYYELSGHVGYIAPKSSFSYTTKNICAGTTVTFENTSLGSEASYNWNFEGADITTSNDKNPSVTYPKAGLYSVLLKSSNTKGNNIKQVKIHIGDGQLGTQIKFATKKLNKALTGSIRLTDEIVTFAYNDLQDLDKEIAYYDICLIDNCYEIKLDNVYTPETCGTPIWKDGVIYKEKELDYYNGFIYQAKWWTGELPDNSSAWTKKQECIPTDESNTIQIINNNSNNNAIIFETNPKKVGIDLAMQEKFCNGATLSTADFEPSEYSTYTIYPNPTSDILHIEGQHIDELIIINAIGKTIDGYRIHDNTFELNTSSYSTGIYFIVILSNNIKTVKKFSKI